MAIMKPCLFHPENGIIDISEGCPKCLEEKERERTTATEPPADLFLVKVQYLSLSTGEVSPREYTYFSEDRLAVEDIVSVPVKDTITKAKVSAIDVPEGEIVAFKDKVKVIPAGSS